MTESFKVGYTNDFLKPDGTVGWGEIGLGTFEDVPGLEFSFLPRHEPVLSAELAADHDALGVLAPRVTADLIDNAPRLAVVARFGVGYDNVDLEACTRNGTAVVITPDGVRRPMAATAMTFILALSHRLREKDRITREGRWADKLDYMGYQVTGKTLGLIGLGNIARDLIHLARPWDLRFLSYDPYVPADAGHALGVEMVELDSLLRQSDYVVVLCKLTDETHHLLDRDRLAMMKPEAFLISIARGPIIDEVALYDALRNDRIRGAGMDVFEQEPVDPANPILQLDNVLVAPHALCWTEEAALGNGMGLVDAILAVRKGNVPANIVNREVVESDSFQKKLAAYRERWGA